MGQVLILVLASLLLLLGCSSPVLAGGSAPVMTPTPIVTAFPKSVPPEAPLKELPRTGLPLVGPLIVALAPLGWKLRKYGFKKSNPDLVWQERELKK